MELFYLILYFYCIYGKIFLVCYFKISKKIVMNNCSTPGGKTKGEASAYLCELLGAPKSSYVYSSFLYKFFTKRDNLFFSIYSHSEVQKFFNDYNIKATNMRIHAIKKHHPEIGCKMYQKALGFFLEQKVN
jgi:hypothetical protein